MNTLKATIQNLLNIRSARSNGIFSLPKAHPLPVGNVSSSTKQSSVYWYFAEYFFGYYFSQQLDHR